MTQTSASIYALPRTREIGPQEGHDPQRIFVFKQLPNVSRLAEELGVGELAKLERRREAGLYRVERWIFSAAEVEVMRARLVEMRKRQHARRCESVKQRRERIAAGMIEARKKIASRSVTPRLAERIEEAAALWVSEGMAPDVALERARAAYLGTPCREQPSDPETVRVSREWQKRQIEEVATQRPGSVATERADATCRMTTADMRRLKVAGPPQNPWLTRGSGAKR
jgi:hypothetical protein